MSYVKKEGRGVLFNNRLEVLTKTHPVLHVLTYGSAAAYFSSINAFPIWTSIGLMTGGAFAWTLVEYLMHRFVFHIQPGPFQYLIHGVHHEFPRDKERLMMPPLPGLVLVCIFYGVWYLPLKQAAPAWMSGFLVGYLLYTFIHYAVHAYKPVKLFRYLWTHHHKHHNPVYENKAFGVSTTLWDRVFGTMPN